MSEPEFTYGQRVVVSEKLVRGYLGLTDQGRTIKGYKREPLMSAMRLLEKKEGDHPYCGKWGTVPVEKQGIFLGYRTLTEGFVIPGHSSYWGDYDAPEYMVTRRIRCAFVSVAPNTNPVHVPLDAIRAAEDV